MKANYFLSIKPSIDLLLANINLVDGGVSSVHHDIYWIYWRTNTMNLTMSANFRKLSSIQQLAMYKWQNVYWQNPWKRKIKKHIIAHCCLFIFIVYCYHKFTRWFMLYYLPQWFTPATYQHLWCSIVVYCRPKSQLLSCSCSSGDLGGLTAQCSTAWTPALGGKTKLSYWV